MMTRLADDYVMTPMGRRRRAAPRRRPRSARGRGGACAARRDLRLARHAPRGSRLDRGRGVHARRLHAGAGAVLRRLGAPDPRRVRDPQRPARTSPRPPVGRALRRGGAALPPLLSARRVRPGLTAKGCVRPGGALALRSDHVASPFYTRSTSAAHRPSNEPGKPASCATGDRRCGNRRWARVAAKADLGSGHRLRDVRSTSRARSAAYRTQRSGGGRTGLHRFACPLGRSAFPSGRVDRLTTGAAGRSVDCSRRAGLCRQAAARPDHSGRCLCRNRIGARLPGHVAGRSAFASQATASRYTGDRASSR